MWGDLPANQGLRLKYWPMILFRPVRVTILAIAVLALIGASVAVPPYPAEAAPPPGSLLVFSGWPSRINGATTAAEAAAELSRYDFVVFGGGIENPAHPDHARTKEVLADPAMAGTLVFGYVNLGVTNGKLTLPQVRQAVNRWQALGADGIQLDAMGYDFGVTRSRQNAVVDYVHSLGMPVVANVWFPDDVFGDDVDPTWNPSGAPTKLGAADYYMYESYWIRLGVPPSVDSPVGWTPQYWLDKAELVATYQAELGFGILSVTTNSPSDVYSQGSFDAAWNKAVEYGHVATGWGEYLFSADDSLAPYRPRPAASGEVQAVCGGLAATIIGTSGPNRLMGTEHPDVIAGLGGADVISGAAGNDLICGNAGDDIIRGGDGADRLWGGGGADQLFGEGGNDRLLGQGGADLLVGGPGADRAAGGPATDSCEAEQTSTCEP